jgi:hypothetical protein
MSFENTIDGYLLTPQEVEGSPVIATDEVTLSFTIKRKYAVLTSSYVPSTSGLADPIYMAPFISESVTEIQGPVTFFERTFSTIPGPRTETRMVPFTRPGQPAVVLSGFTQLPIGWSAYGTCAPSTRLVLANVNFTYQIGPFAPEQAPAQTQITYKGSPVDYFGEVFVQGSEVLIVSAVINQGVNVYETRWNPAGYTVPSSLPPQWTLNVNVTRWKGPIWQMEVVIVPNVM